MQRLGALQIVISVLTIITALIHLWLAVEQLTEGMIGGIMFVFNGLGYLGLLAALYTPLPIEFIKKNHSLVRYALMGFAIITIVAWLAIGERSFIGYATKFVELVLVILLFIESRQAIASQ